MKKGMEGAIKLLECLYESVENYDHSFNSDEYVTGKLKGIQTCIDTLKDRIKED